MTTAIQPQFIVEVQPARTMAEVLERLRDCPEAHAAAYRVGRWVWVSFTSQPPVEVRDCLKSIGFRWNRKRGAWQHNCGYFTKSSPYDPRDKYSVIALAGRGESDED